MFFFGYFAQETTKSMTSTQLVETLNNYCISNSNPQNVEKYSRFFKDEYVAYGLTQPQIKEKAKELLKDKELTLEIIREATPKLFENGRYEDIVFALLLLNGRNRHFTRDTFDFLSGLFEVGISNWAHADTIGMWIVPHFLKKNIININDLESWMVSNNKFQRRCVPVSLIKTLKTTQGYSQLFSFIEPLMTDSQREVHQGVGWFLREAWKKQPAQTEYFLLKWKGNAPRLIIQYACEKMTAEQKQRFKRNKNDVTKDFIS